MTHSWWRRRLILPAALLCVPAWLSACAPEPALTAEPAKSANPAARTLSPSPTPTGPARRSSSRECDLLVPTELQQVFGKPGWRKEAQYAQPHETGWRATCLYGNEDPALPEVVVSVVTGRPPGWLGKAQGPTKDANGKPLPRSQPEPISNLGDEAWSALGYGIARAESGDAEPVYGAGVAVVGIRTGTIHVLVTVEVPEPKDPESADFGSTLRLGRKAIVRASDPTFIRLKTATGPCGEVSLDDASAFGRMQLVSNRLTQHADGELACLLGGKQGFVWISVDTGADAVQTFRKNVETGVPVNGVGDRAYQLGVATFILTGQRLVVVLIGPENPAEYISTVGAPGPPNQEGKAFLRTVVDLFA